MTDIPPTLTPNDAVGLPARAAALDLLIAALGGRAGMDEGLSHPALAALPARDRAFARALVMATLRYLGPIDSALQAKVKKAPPDKVVQILRLGVAQVFVLKTPPHAAVTTSVDLVAQDKGLAMFKGLVNAVLRGLIREPPEMDDPELMAPSWLYARWRAAFGAEAARGIAAAIAQEPATDLSLKDAARAAGLATALEATVLPGGSLRTTKRGDLATWPEFAEGAWWVQDAAAAIPARLLDVRAGQTALDMCAAPGGKTLQLAAAGAQVTAVDRAPARLKRVAENLARMGLTAETHAADVQSKLLDAAARRTKAGGRLVYCVCSLEPEEGEGQVAAFLGRTPEMSLDPIGAGEGGTPKASVRPDGTLRILPQHMDGGMDGFYVARFRKG